MSAVGSSKRGRNIGFAGLTVLVGSLVTAAVWHLGLSSYPVIDASAWAPSWVTIPLVIFLAASLSSTVGFAFSAIAAAMIFHLVPDNVEAVQIMMVASIAIQAYSVACMHQLICWRMCTPFLLGGAATIPIGIYLLLSVRPQVYVLAMGLGLVLYGTYMLFRRPFLVRRGGTFANVAVGALGGITGPLAAFPGAFITIWCGMRGWDKSFQRSLYQPYILVIQIVTVGGLSVASERSSLNLELIAYALPAVAGAYFGLGAFRRLTDGQFQKLVNLALIASGIALAFK